MASAIITTFTRRPRLLIGAGVGIVAYILCPWQMREATRALVGWNVGAWVFLLCIFAGGFATAYFVRKQWI